MIYRYRIHKLHCSGCAAQMEEALANLPGVQHAGIDMGAKCLRIESDSLTEAPPLEDINALLSGIENGTSASPWPEEGEAAPPRKEEETEEHDGPGPRAMLISGLLLGAGLVLEHTWVAFPKEGPALWVMLLLCYGLPYVICGRKVLLDGWKSLLRKDFFNEFTLMGGATVAAIAIGQLPEAVGVMLFYCIGEYVQEKAAGRSRNSIRALLAAKPAVAHVCEEDGTNLTDMQPEDVTPGTFVLVRPGEKIPLDGVVSQGISQVDTSPLTGEPMPVAVEQGSNVFAGCINTHSALTIKVTARYADTSVARIMEMVENASARKAPTERFITRFARYYTPAVVAAAFLVALIPPLLGMGTFSEWCYRALVLLVISCPCALVISIPLGYFGGIGAASRRGILVKGGYVLDALRHIRVAAFDKTGTLTQGSFSITSALPAPGVDKEQLLAVAALAESRSNHPLARAIMNAAGKVLPVLDLQAREIPGKGMLAMADGRELLVGTPAFLREQGVHDLPAMENLDNGGSLVLVAENKAYLGSLIAADTLRPEVPQALADLREQGIHTLAMLTGDHKGGAAAIASQLSLDVIKAQLLPEEKAAALQSLGPVQNTLFMGDGINDAPVLATAGVGVAMGGLGSEAAVETADVVILDDNPARLPELLRIAARTRRIVWQNIALALSIKLCFMGLGIVGLSGLWEAVFADVGVALLAVLNAGRAMKA